MPPQGPRPGPGRPADLRRLDRRRPPRRPRRPPPPAAPAAPRPRPRRTTSRDDEIDSWLVADSASAAAERPSGVYGGDTITITAFKDAKSGPAKPAAARRPPATTSTSARPTRRNRSDEAAETAEDSRRGRRPRTSGDEDDEDEDDEDEAAEEVPEEFIDESNPFYVAKKAQKEQAKQTGPAKPSFKDTSDAANDILRKMMERRRARSEPSPSGRRSRSAPARSLATGPDRRCRSTESDRGSTRLDARR